MIDEALKQWATARQIEYIDTINLLGSANKAAPQLGIDRSTITQSIKSLKKRAAAQGYSPDHNLTRIIPEPYVARGHSTYYDRDGKPTQQWVKTRLDDRKWLELLRETAATMGEELPRAAPSKPPLVATASELCNQYTLTDAHLGMLAWHEEGGADWDLKIAEKTLNEAFAHMIRNAPRAKRCVIAQLGDFFHSDGILPVTPTSNHVLDQGSRFTKIVRVGIRLLRSIVSMALEAHEEVTLLIAEGNHDLSTSIVFREMFFWHYENEPRITVIRTPLPFYAIQHGKTGLFYHHGHIKKIASLPTVFATEFPRIWGESTTRYGHAGHLHSLEEKDEHGILLTRHATLAARDAYSARLAFKSSRQASRITYHSEFGEVDRRIVTPAMLGML